MADAQVQHAFVSYVHEDSAAVDQLVAVLQAASIPVWKDSKDLWPGEDWQQKIRKAIEDGSLAFLACFSTRGVQKHKSFMNAELIWAAEQIRLMRPGHVWLIPIRLDDCELPYFDVGNYRTLDNLQRIDLFGAGREANLARLISAVNRIFGTSAATPAAVAAAIASAQDAHRGPLLAAALKAALSDPGQQMELEALILDEVRSTTRALKDETRFPVTGGPSPTIASGIARVQEYDGLVEPLTHVAVTLGAWGSAAQASLVTRAMRSTATTAQDVRSGYAAYSSLRTYPLLPVLYAGALGAVARGNGRMLAAFTDPVVTINGQTAALPVAVTPWRPFADAEVNARAVSALTRVALDGGTLEEHAEALQAGREGTYDTPISEYMFARLRPLLDPYVLDDAEYAQVFHHAEALIALAELDWMTHNSDSVKDFRRSRSHWVGRYLHRERHLAGSAGLAYDLLQEIRTNQNTWWPIAGGMFGGDWKRAEAAAADFITNETEERRGRW